MIRWAAAILVTLLVPLLLLWEREHEAVPRPVAVRAVTILSPGRRLFGDGLDDPSIRDMVAGAEPGVPVLTGVVGRLPDAAVALVQGADGRSHSLAIGARADGWRLEGLAADRALFSKGARRVRVRLPAEDQ